VSEVAVTDLDIFKSDECLVFWLSMHEVYWKPEKMNSNFYYMFSFGVESLLKLYWKNLYFDILYFDLYECKDDELLFLSIRV
jgi:hypothetical protein